VRRRSGSARLWRRAERGRERRGSWRSRCVVVLLRRGLRTGRRRRGGSRLLAARSRSAARARPSVRRPPPPPWPPTLRRALATGGRARADPLLVLAIPLGTDITAIKETRARRGYVGALPVQERDSIEVRSEHQDGARYEWRPVGDADRRADRQGRAPGRDPDQLRDAQFTSVRSSSA